MAKTTRKIKKTKKKQPKEISEARVYITATFNNTLITFTDLNGDVLCWGTAGSAGFKGTGKSTPYAATMAADSVIGKARNMGINELGVYIKGPGSGRESALRALKTAGFRFNLIADVTPIPHNGPRPKKARRV